ncbi:MAG: aldo/keto reductase [Clostridiaceae bacterium]|jgi:aryl-alcohol dehydrogenase-like predicted oxidoreductase|nr:aldo/keto reductase [Clostridiaceae bacterium]
MKHVSINSTDLTVSNICLGTGRFGNSLDASSSKQQLSHFVYSGYNFIDTARVYGNSEKVIGEWLKETSLRSSVVISSKGAHPDHDWNPRMTKKIFNLILKPALPLWEPIT